MSYIQTDNKGNIIQYIEVGEKPEINGYSIPQNTSEEVIKNIFSYKFIDGQLIYKTETDQVKLDKVKSEKISQMSIICKSLITKGIDIGEEHFSLTTTDQANILSLSFDAQLSLLINSEESSSLMYHADGQECRAFSVSEILNLATLAKEYIKFHTTYFNFLKQQILSKEIIEEVISINYGQELEEEYQIKFFEIVGETCNLFKLEFMKDNIDYNRIIYDIPDATMSLEEINEEITQELFNSTIISDELEESI